MSEKRKNSCCPACGRETEPPVACASCGYDPGCLVCPECGPVDSENLILPALRAAVREIKAERHSAHAAGKVVGAVGMHAALLIIRKHLGKWLEEGE